MALNNNLIKKLDEHWQGLEAEKSVSQYHCTCSGLSSYNIEMQNWCGPLGSEMEKSAPNPKSFINFSTGDYLGMGQRQEVVEASKEILHKYGTGAYGSPMLNGYFDIHKKLEHGLASFHDCDDVILFSSGFITNVAIMCTLLGPQDVVILDESSHGSLLFGSMSSRAQVKIYQKNDFAKVEELLKSYSDDDITVMLVSCGVFSMSGEIADLPKLIEIGKKYNATIMVDDAHGVGVLGKNGKGTLEHYGISSDDVDIHMGILSKTFAGVGGYIGATQKIVNYLRSISSPYVLSTAIPPHVAAGCLKALEILKNEGHEISSNLVKKANLFRDLIRDKGIKVTGDGTAIVSIPVMDDSKIFDLNSKCLEDGLFLSPVVYPGVKKGSACLRLSVTSLHDEDVLQKSADIIAKNFLEIIK